VYVKFHPQATKSIEIHLVISFELKKVAEERLETTVDKITQLIIEQGDKVETFKT
jgi:hypothetical protein